MALSSKSFRFAATVAPPGALKHVHPAANASPGNPSLSSEPATPSFTVEGEVTEVLPGFGLAHIRTVGGAVYGVNRSTPGIDLDQLHEGQLLRCEVTLRFNRVLHAELIG